MSKSESPAENMGDSDLDAMRKMKAAFDSIKQQLNRVIVGQDQVIEELLIALSPAVTACWKACPVLPRPS